MSFEYQSDEDKINLTGFIDKNKILSYLPQEAIFNLLFEDGFLVGEYIYSPFREENNPSALLKYDEAGRLLLFDYVEQNNPFDCFGAIQYRYKFSSFYKTLLFLKNIIETGEIKDSVKRLPKISLPTVKTLIYIKSKPYTKKELDYWASYGITYDQLNEDFVYSLESYYLRTSKGKDVNIVCKTMSFAYSDFDNFRKKIYTPSADKRFKFITNTIKDDLYGYSKLPKAGKQLIFTKSYKDYRVLKNQGLIVVGIQGEGIFPSEKMLKELSERFKKFVIFFDNDKTGIVKSKEFYKILSKYKDSRCLKRVNILIKYNKFGITDPSDFYYYKGEDYLKKFLKEKNIN